MHGAPNRASCITNYLPCITKFYLPISDVLADIVVCVMIVVTKSQYSYTRARKVLHKLYEITEKHCVKTKEYINKDRGNSSIIREGMYLRQAKRGGGWTNDYQENNRLSTCASFQLQL